MNHFGNVFSGIHGSDDRETVATTANEGAESTEEETVYVHDLDVFVTW